MPEARQVQQILGAKGAEHVKGWKVSSSEMGFFVSMGFSETTNFPPGFVGILSNLEVDFFRMIWIQHDQTIVPNFTPNRWPMNFL